MVIWSKQNISTRFSAKMEIMMEGFIEYQYQDDFCEISGMI